MNVFDSTRVIRLMLGDERSPKQVLFIKSNLDASELLKAYEKGATKIGVNVLELFKQSPTLNVGHYFAIEDAGYPVELWTSIRKQDRERLRCQLDLRKNVDIDADTYVKLFFFTIKRGDPTFKYSFLNQSDTQDPKHQGAVHLNGKGFFLGNR